MAASVRGDGGGGGEDGAAAAALPGRGAVQPRLRGRTGWGGGAVQGSAAPQRRAGAADDKDAGSNGHGPRRAGTGGGLGVPRDRWVVPEDLAAAGGGGGSDPGGGGGDGEGGAGCGSGGGAAEVAADGLVPAVNAAGPAWRRPPPATGPR